MKSTSTDPRALRTRQSLRGGLMQTVIEKPFRDITVNDITSSAGVNRATFYLHYDDKYDLLEDCANNLLSDIRQDIETQLDFNPASPPDMPEHVHYKRMLIVLGHFNRYRAFYLAMMGKHGDPLFYNLFRDGASTWMKQMMTTILEYQNKPVDKDLIEMMVRFQSAGNFDVILWWLEHDTHIPIEVMAERLALVTLPPLIRLIQGEDYQY